MKRSPGYGPSNIVADNAFGISELVLREHPDGRVTGVVMREMRSFSHIAFVDGFVEPEEVERGIAVLRGLDFHEKYSSWEKEMNVDAASLDEAIASSQESSRGQKFVCLYRGNEWLSGIWTNPHRDALLAELFKLSSIADFHGTRVSKAKRASRPGLSIVRKNMTLAGDYAALDAALSMVGPSVPESSCLEVSARQDYEANAGVKTLCDWWNANAPECMQEAGAFRVYAWNQDDLTFITGNPKDPAMLANLAKNLPCYALFEKPDRPTVLVSFLRGRRFNTNEIGGTLIYSADGQSAYDVDLNSREVDEAYYALRGLESLRLLRKLP